MDVVSAVVADVGTSKMKIGLVSPYDWAYPGGVTNHIDRMAKEYERRGHYVSIIAPSSKPPEELDAHNLTVIGKPIPVPIGGSIARVTLSFHRAARVRAVLEEESFDVVHMHEPLVPALPTTVLRLSRSVNVGTFHAYLRSSRVYRSARPILMRWFRRLHGKIAVSEPAADLASRYFPGYYNVIPNGIDIEHFSSDREPMEKFNDGKVNILFVGRMEKRKGLAHLLSAYGRIKWEYPNVRLIVVGPGRLDATSERLIGERALSDVEFVGAVPFAELPRYYQMADIFCSPATGMESFGIVLLEAMAAGTAIVASNIRGYAGVVADGRQGSLVEPKDETALAAALVDLLNNPEKRREMGTQGRLHAERYSWPRVADQVLGYYERLLVEREPGRLSQGE
ncbi:glycosyltransferase family 4 protein [Dehalococcoidia bacterium]|nr:glycosyltransferase family 4 protein [Dehalococcoidia bacterium]